MEEPPERYAICPSCGTEFGNDDFVLDPRSRPVRWAELRLQWLNARAPWFDDSTPRPQDWRPFDLMATPGVGLNLTSTVHGIRKRQDAFPEPTSPLFKVSSGSAGTLTHFLKARSIA